MKLWDFKAIVYRFWRRFFPINLIWQAEQKAARELFERDNQATQRVLNVGCGVGDNLPLTLNFVVQVDLSQQMLQQVRQKQSSANQRTLLVQADATSLPFRSQTFDILLCIGVTEYISDQISLLKEFQRVLVPEGGMLITISHRHPLNYLRLLLGHQLHLLPEEKFSRLLQSFNFRLIASRRTLIQQQFWTKKIDN